MSYYPQTGRHIRDKVKVVLDLSNYTTKKKIDHATGVDTSDLTAKKDFIALKAEVDKLDINKLTNVPTSLNNLKTKVDDLDVGKLKTVSVDLRNLSDIVDNEVIKNAKFNTLKTKVNNLEKKIPDGTNLVHINQYNTDKQNLEKKIGDVDGLVQKTDYEAKIKDIEGKYFTNADYNKYISDIFDIKIKQKELFSKSDNDKKGGKYQKENYFK